MVAALVVNMNIDPMKKYPITQSDGEVWPHTMYLKAFIDQPNIEIGDYSYYNDFRTDISDLRATLAPYLHPMSPEKLVIGKFVQIAHGVEIITSSANHQMDGFSTYHFNVFGEPWANAYQPNYPNKGDTYIGHDVWIGHQALIMPGVTIGSSAIIDSGSIVTKDVEPYSIVAGNPAKPIRKRFNEEVINALLGIKWWHWDINKITQNLNIITSANIETLKRA